MSFAPNEPVSELNARLRSLFGYFDTTGHQLWRIVFSADEFEQRWVSHTPEGFNLLQKVVALRPKYRSYINPPAYVLERAIGIPDFAVTDLVDKFSYEPVWVFKDNLGNNLPPIWPAIRMIIDSVNSKSARIIGAKYHDPEIGSTPEETLELQNTALDKLTNELFGESSDIADSLHYKNAIIVPHKQFGDS